MATCRVFARLGNVGILVAALSVGAGPAHADPTTLYVDTTNCSDQGPGTVDRPFCTVQKAADIVNPGQRVLISGPGPTRTESLVISRSGTADAPIVFDSWHKDLPPIHHVPGTAPTITVRGVHDVELRGLQVFSQTAADAILVDSSTRVIVDGNTVPHLAGSEDLPGANGVHVTGSSQITVSRNTFGVFGQPVRVDGGSDVTIAANEIPEGPNGGITVAGAPHTAITGNTVREFCNRGITVTGASTGTSIQNNVLAFALGGSVSSFCQPIVSHGIEVDATAAPGVTLDYNLVFLNAARHYLWAGTIYNTKADLVAATGQGAHDLNVNPDVGTPAVDSANAEAPGEPVTDIAGKPRVDNPLVPNTGNGFHDRGAREAQDRFTSGQVTANAFRAPVGGRITVTGRFSDAWGLQTTCAIDFGDGTTVTASPCTATHAYTATGNYAIVVDASNPALVTRREVWPIAIGPAGGSLQPSLTATPDHALAVIAIPGIGFDPWNLASTTIDFGDGQPPVTSPGASLFHTYDRPGTYTIRATITDANGASGSASTTFSTQGSGFVPFGPSRFLDTRTGLGIGGTARKVASGATVRLKVGGANGIPAGITAVVMNTTVTNPDFGGYITVHPDGVTRPLASNLNFNSGQTVPNLTMVSVGSNGFVDLYNGSGGTVDLVADVTGYYARAGTIDGFHPLRPFRLVDTRSGGGPILGGNALVQRVTGTVPAEATAVALNVTVTNPRGLGFVTAYPDGTPGPLASNLNYLAGQTIANAVIVPIGRNGSVDFYTAATADLIVDVAGYFTPGGPSYFVPTTPGRVLDTRTIVRGPLAPGETATFNLAVAAPFGLPGPTAVVFNATVTDTQSSGFLTAWGADGERPPNSTLNFTAGSIVPNLVVTGLPQFFGNEGNVSFFNGSGGRTNLVVDVFGYFGSV